MVASRGADSLGSCQPFDFLLSKSSCYGLTALVYMRTSSIRPDQKVPLIYIEWEIRAA